MFAKRSLTGSNFDMMKMLELTCLLRGGLAAFIAVELGETAVDSLCGKLATYVTSTTPR